MPSDPSRLNAIRGGIFALVLAPCLLAACRGPQAGTAASAAPAPSLLETTAQPGPDAAALLRRFVAGTSVEGRPIEVLTIGGGPDTALILASIHGDEPAGTPLVWRLAEYLQEHPDLLKGRRVVLVPAVNPDGLFRCTRCNARGVDLNRNFLTSNRRNNRRYGFEALSEPEAGALSELIIGERPARIVSIHQPLACIDYDGPAIALAVRMSELCGLPVRKLGPLPGSLGSFCGGAKAIPTITFELPRSAEELARDELWQRYGAALLAAVLYPQSPPPADALAQPAGILPVAGDPAQGGGEKSGERADPEPGIISS